MDPIALRIALLVAAFTNNFSGSSPRQPVRPAPVKIATNEPKAPFEWTRSEKKQFLSKLKVLKRGDKIEDVVKLLGPPYDLHLIMPKESNDARGTLCRYYLKKKENDGSSEIYDQDISLDFDLDNRLEAILTNIKGLKVGNLVSLNTERAELENLGEP